MIEYFLMVIIVILLGGFGVFIYWTNKQHNKQINHLINAVVAKTPQDLTNLTLAEETRIEMENQPPLGPLSDEFVSVGGADSAAFDKMIEFQTSDDTPDEGSLNT